MMLKKKFQMIYIPSKVITLLVYFPPIFPLRLVTWLNGRGKRILTFGLEGPMAVLSNGNLAESTAYAH